MSDTQALPVKKSPWKWLIWALLALLALLVAAIVWLDSSSGQRWVINRLAGLHSTSGFQIVIGAFDGSLYSKARVRDVALKDPRGTFLTIHEAQLDWSPAKIWKKHIDIRSADIHSATWHYVPKFNPGDPDAPLLPDWDIAVERLKIRRLVLEPPVARRSFAIRAEGNAMISDGRAKLALDMAAFDRSDRARVYLDAVPDANRFDAFVNVTAPKDGLFATMTGWQPGGMITLAGKGTFKDWRGQLQAQSDAVKIVDAHLAFASGKFAIDGKIAPPVGINPPLAQALAALPQLSATVSVDNKILATQGTLSGAAASLVWQGRLDTRSNALENSHVTLTDTNGAILALLDPNLKATQAKILANLSGNVRAPAIQSVMTAQQLSWQRYQLQNFSGTASRTSDTDDWRVSLTAQQGKTGLAWLDQKLATLSANGVLKIANRRLEGRTITITGKDLRAEGAVTFAFANGAWTSSLARLQTSIAAGTNGPLPVRLSGTASAPGRGAAVTIAASGTVSLASWQGPAEIVRLLGQNPALTARLVVQPDGSTRAQTLSLEGNGSRFSGNLVLANDMLDARLDGRIKSLSRLAPGLPFRAPDHVPVALVLQGPLAAPTIAAQLQAPQIVIAGTQLRDVLFQMQPDGPDAWRTALRADAAFGRLDATTRLLRRAQGFRLADLAGSLGPARLAGTIDLDRNNLATGTANIQLEQPGQQLVLIAELKPENGRQHFAANLAGSRLDQLWQGQQLKIGKINGKISGLLGPVPVLQTGLELADASYQDWRIADASLTGNGPIHQFTATYKMSGARGVTFSLAGNLTTAGATGGGKNLPDIIEATASGMVAQKSFRLTTPARVRRLAKGWQLEPTELTYAGGTARLSGTQADKLTDARLDLTNANLELLDLIRPNLGLAGKATGNTVLQVRDGRLTMLNGTLALKRVRRAGLFQFTLPLDAQGTIALDGAALRSQLLLRANGRDAGSADILLARSSSGDFANGALSGTVRFDGPAEALWGLVGTDANDLRGKLKLSAALAGTLGNPRVRGTATMREGRYENVALGLIVNNIKTDADFEDAHVSFTDAAGTFPAGGTVTANGRAELSAEKGFPSDIRLSLVRAAIVKRDDLAVTATGNLTFTYGPQGGKITGPLTLNEARIRAGGPVSDPVPEITVREINKPVKMEATRISTPRLAAKPLRLDLDVAAKEKIFVNGLGLVSEWGGAVNVTGTASAPRLRGQMSLIRGTYDFAGRRFTVDDGDISFQGTTPVNPVLNIRASTRAGERDILIRVTGVANQPDIQFAAAPALPQDEVLSRLLFGASIQNLSPLEAVQLAAALNQLSSSRGGLNVLGSVKRATGIDRLRVVAADKKRGSSTALSGGKYLTDRIYVEVSTDGRGYTATVIEVDITRTLSVLSEIATLGGTNVGVKWSKDY